MRTWLSSLWVAEKSYEYWLKKNKYYHTFLAQFYAFVVPKDATVLQVGCKTGHLLAAVQPRVGVGLDYERESIEVAQRKYPHYEFHCGSLNDFSWDGTFDYVIVSSATMETDDIQELFVQIKKFCTPHTRIIIDYYSYVWEPILRILQKCNLRRPTPLKNWVSAYDIQNFLQLAGFEVVTKGNQLLIPTYIPLISWVCNSYLVHLPLINKLALSTWVVARPQPQKTSEQLTVSVIIPCRNEKGNIEPAVLRCPPMGAWTELIFVEGHSHDGTLEELERVKNKYPERNITYYKQPGKGKGDAMRLGFAKAQGQVLLILDGDLTTPPEEMPKFYEALQSGLAEFVNGSRLVYGMESEAMRFLNLVANYFFSVLFSWLLGQRVKDTLCGTKVLLKTNYQKIADNRAFFGDFDPFGDFDLLFGAAKLHLKIVDLPIRYKNRTYGSSQIRRFYDGLMLFSMSWIAFKKFKVR